MKNDLSPMSLKKPTLSPVELINKMKEQGITFKLENSSDEFANCEYAENYLVKNNNFFRLCSYRNNFSKHIKGINAGKYINLDFRHLKLLANFDKDIRKEILNMCIDVEHGVKLTILEDFENKKHDGYEIVRNFLKHDDYTAKEILKKMNNGYLNHDLNQYITTVKNESLFYYTYKEIDYYFDIPVWIFLETLTFGGLIKFYDFYYQGNKPPIEKSVLNSVKSIRNACAHNNCIYNNLNKDKSFFVNNDVKLFISRTIGGNYSKDWLKYRVIHEICCVFYSLKTFCTNGVLNKDLKFTEQVINCFLENSDFFGNDNNIKSVSFLKRIVEKLLQTS